MINLIWLVLIATGILTAAHSGQVEVVTEGAIAGAGQAVTIVIGLIGVTALWSGMMRIAQEAGLTRLLVRLLHPLVRWLFPSVPPQDQALGAITLSLAAGLLGVGNACTPLGLKTMQELQRLNKGSSRASDAMCTFVIVVSSSLTLVPATIIALRTAAGSADPTRILGPTIGATAASTAAAIMSDRVLRHWRRGQ